MLCGNENQCNDCYTIYTRYIYRWDLPIFEILCTSNSVASTYGNAFLSDKRTSRPNPTTCSKTEHCYDVILLQLPTTCWKTEHCYVVIRLILIPDNPAKVRSLTRHRSISFDAPIDSIKMVHDVAYWNNSNYTYFRLKKNTIYK